MNNIIILIIIIIILITIYIIWLYQRDISGQFGTYSDTILGQCINTTGLCTDKGIQNNIKVCNINPITGKGCITENGTQSYDSIITTQECNLTCFSSIWEQVTNNAICIPPADPDNNTINPAPNGQCLPRLNNNNAKVLGRKTITFKCVAHDSMGPNNCTNLALQNITSPTGVNGILPLLKTYNIGDTIDVTEECDPIATNPVCGYWNTCSWNNSYIFSPNCVTTTGNNPASLLRDGFLYNSADCILDNGTILDFNSNNPTTHQCLQNPTNINCNTDNFNIDFQPLPNSIISNNLICSKDYNSSNISNNPVCLQLCRLYPTTNTSLGTNLDILINNPFICLDFNTYLAGYQLPRIDNNSQTLLYNMYEPDNNFPSNVNLYDTDLLVVPVGYKYNGAKTNCSDEELLLSTAIIMTLGNINAINNNEIESKIMMNIPPGFTGWLNNSLHTTSTWNQMQTQYNGVGTSFYDAEVFKIIMLSPFDNTPVPGYPNSLGTMVISIRTLSNAFLNPVYRLDGTTIPYFNILKIIIFDASKFNYSIRNNVNSNTSCNLYITTT